MKHTPTRINNYPRSSVEDCTPHRVPPGSSSHCRLQWHKSVSCACTSAMHSRNEVSASSFRNQTAYPTKRRSAWSSDQSDCSLRRHRQLLHSDDLGRRTTCTMCCPCGARCSLLLILFVFICTMAGDALHDTRALSCSLALSPPTHPSYATPAMPHDWPLVWPPYCSLMQVSWSHTPTKAPPSSPCPVASLTR